ncbi:MAG: hypothetical protein HND57_08415 [Planctomycetes bacterium]|nr:hypothetical protein [Planctomycetota bacterium]
MYIGATLILIAVAYSTGHRFGREKAENSFIAGLSQTPAQEPINNNGSSDTNTQRPITGGFGDGTESRNQGPTQPQSSQDSRSQPNGSGSGAASRSGNQAAPAASITTDTRENGYNYIIVEQFPADEASRVADYLIRNGIDVMILPANDRSLRRVVVRQGYLGWRSNQEGQQTLDSVRRLGWAWRSRHGGSKDFEQAFVELFD